jgi:hypothetical protein
MRSREHRPDFDHWGGDEVLWDDDGEKPAEDRRFYVYVWSFVLHPNRRAGYDRR